VMRSFYCFSSRPAMRSAPSNGSISPTSPRPDRRFLASLETDRHNGIATRNARLGAIHVFARFMAAHRPEQEQGNRPFSLGDSHCETPAVWHPPVTGPAASDASARWFVALCPLRRQ